MGSYILFFFNFYLFFGRAACGILVAQTGIEPAPPALEARSLNHWTAREVPLYTLEKGFHQKLFLNK